MSPPVAAVKPQSKLDILRAVGTPNPVVDLEAAKQYVRALTGSSATPLAWSAINERQGGERRKSLFLFGPLHEHEAALIEANEQGSSIECIINSTDGAGMTAGDVLGVRALWICTDSERARFTREQVDAVRPEPDLITQARAGEFNLFWTFGSGECSPQDFAQVMRKLALHFKSSHQVIHLEQRLRVPGFWAWPAGSLPFQVEIVSDRSRGQA